MNQKIITRETCKLCGSSAIKDILSLGDLYISTFLEKKDDGIKAPLDLMLCDKYSLLQLRHTAFKNS